MDNQMSLVPRQFAAHRPPDHIGAPPLLDLLMSRESRGRVLDMQPHPTLCGAHVVSVIVTKAAGEAIRKDMQITLVTPEADPYARSADK